MCSSGQAVRSGRGCVQSSSSSRHSSSTSQYVLCALGVGLVSLGVIMILWRLVPSEVHSNSTGEQHGGNANDETTSKMSYLAFVLVGAGLASLLLSVCLGVRNKRRRTRGTTTATATQYTDHVPGQAGEISTPASTYDVPSYDEAVTSGRYPIHQSNLQRNSSQLPSYEDLVAAVENEGAGADNRQNVASPCSHAGPPVVGPNTEPTHSRGRASYIFKPLRARRIKSEKLHVKDIRLNIQTPAQGGRVTIEPLTPPPQYEDKGLEIHTEPL